MLHGHIAVLVSGGAAQKRNVDMYRLEEQAFSAGDFDQFDEIVFGKLALLTAAMAWIDECTQPDVGNKTRTAGRHFAH